MAYSLNRARVHFERLLLDSSDASQEARAKNALDLVWLGVRSLFLQSTELSGVFDQARGSLRNANLRTVQRFEFYEAILHALTRSNIDESYAQVLERWIDEDPGDRMDVDEAPYVIPEEEKVIALLSLEMTKDWRSEETKRDFIKEALKLANEIGSTEMLARCEQVAGMGDKERFGKGLEEAAKKAASADEELQAEIWEGIANFCAREAVWDKSLNAAEKSRKNYEVIGDSLGEARAELLSAEALSQLGRHEEAISLGEKLLQTMNFFASHGDRLNAWGRVGKIYLKAGDLERYLAVMENFYCQTFEPRLSSYWNPNSAIFRAMILEDVAKECKEAGALKKAELYQARADAHRQILSG